MQPLVEELREQSSRDPGVPVWSVPDAALHSAKVPAHADPLSRVAEVHDRTGTSSMGAHWAESCSVVVHRSRRVGPVHHFRSEREVKAARSLEQLVRGTAIPPPPTATICPVGQLQPRIVTLWPRIKHDRGVCRSQRVEFKPIIAIPPGLLVVVVDSCFAQSCVCDICHSS